MSTTIADCAHPQSIQTRSYTEIGLTRRAQALVAEGWTRQSLSAATSISPAALKAILHGRTPPARTQTEQLVALYEARRRPPNLGADTRSAQRYAAAQGWVPRSLEVPTTSHHEANSYRSPRTHDVAALLEDCEWLARTGEGLFGSCRRLHVRPAALYRLLLRHGRLDLWQRLSGSEAAA